MYIIQASLFVYRLGYGPFKAEGGVRFPDREIIHNFLQNVLCIHIKSKKRCKNAPIINTIR